MRPHTTIRKSIAGLAAAALGLGALTLTATPALAIPQTPATEATATETPVAASAGQVPDTQESGDEEAGAGEGSADPDGTGESETPVVDNDTNESDNGSEPPTGEGDADGGEPEDKDSDSSEEPSVDPAWNQNAAVGSMKWGIKTSFREYVREGHACGHAPTEGPNKGVRCAVTVLKPAAGKDVFSFPQVGNSWNPKTDSGDIRFSGRVNMKGHWDAWTERYTLFLDFSNPVISVKPNGSGVIRTKVGKTEQPIAEFTLTKSSKSVKKDGSIHYSGIETTLTKFGAENYFANLSDSGPAGTFYKKGDKLDGLNFTVGADEKKIKPVDTKPNENRGNKKEPRPVEKPKPSKRATHSSTGGVAGSLTWGVSTGFADYTTNKSRPGGKSGGKILTNGVGGGRGGWVFPQASGGSWNKKNQTGTVRFSGVVTFTAHKGLMNESFANPVITVTSASSGTISVGGRTFGLNLAAANKSTGKNGEVTWTGVPVSGSISGGSGSAGGSIAVDPLSFTVGVAGGASYGSTEEGEEKTVYTAAATPPTTTGLQILSDADKLTPGGRIEIQANGFDAEDENVLVVLYSDPIVLDDTAKADADGTVTWSGTLPDNIEPGEHTLTLQGSSSAGAIIKIASDKDKKSAKNAAAQASELLATEESTQQAGIAAIAAYGPNRTWEWWASAAGLVVIAACTTLLAIRQRKQHGAGTPGHTV